MQNRASCHCGRYILRRHAIRSFRYAFANARIGRRARGKGRTKRKERGREKERNGREAAIGKGGGDRVERARGIFIRDTHVECGARTHTRTHRHCHDVACAGRVQKKRRTQLCGGTRISSSQRGDALIDTSDGYYCDRYSRSIRNSRCAACSRYMGKPPEVSPRLKLNRNIEHNFR